MTGIARVSDDPRLRRIRDIVFGLCEGRSAAPPCAEADEVDRLLADVEALAAEIEAARASAERKRTRLEELTDVCLALVSFDYDKKAVVGEENDIFDGMAAALNMLGEELSASTVSVAYVSDIFESMSDVLVVAEAEQGITRVNEATCALAALRREELVGAPLEAIFPGVSVADVITRGGIHDEEMTMLAADGMTSLVSFSASLLHKKQGNTKEIVCVARDLTANKKIEEEQWRLREVLQRQSILLEELSIPLIPMTKDVIVVPLVGSLEGERTERIAEALLGHIQSRGARTAILDITGIRAVDAAAVEGLVRAVHAVRLLGAEALLTGVRADFARMLMQSGVELGIATFSTLQQGIAHALRRR